jgi:hypothetical protein
LAHDGKLAARSETLHAQSREQAPVDQLPAQDLLDRSARLERALAKVQADNRALKRTKADLSDALARERVALEAMRRSTSWRVTWPLRAAGDAYRGLWRTVRRSLQQHRNGSSSGVAAPRAPGMALAQAQSEAAQFFREGFLAPIDLYTSAQCRLICRHYRRTRWPAPLVERKALAAHDSLFYDIATRPALLALLRVLLGEHIVLWGAKVIRREPDQKHPWHTDIESSAADGRFVSVWIGLENTSQASGLHLLSRSHNLESRSSR